MNEENSLLAMPLIDCKPEKQMCAAYAILVSNVLQNAAATSWSWERQIYFTKKYRPVHRLMKYVYVFVCKRQLYSLITKDLQVSWKRKDIQAKVMLKWAVIFANFDMVV